MPFFDFADNAPLSRASSAGDSTSSSSTRSGDSGSSRAGRVVVEGERRIVVGGFFNAGPNRTNVIDFVGTVDAGYTCLQDDLEKFMKGLAGKLYKPDGTLDPAELAKMSAEERKRFLDDVTWFKSWTVQFRQWKSFAEGYQTQGWWDRNFSSDSDVAWNQTIVFRNDLMTWRADALKQYGVRGLKLTCGEPAKAPDIPAESGLEKLVATAGDKLTFPIVAISAVLVTGGVIYLVSR